MSLNPCSIGRRDIEEALIKFIKDYDSLNPCSIGRRDIKLKENDLQCRSACLNPCSIGRRDIPLNTKALLNDRRNVKELKALIMRKKALPGQFFRKSNHFGE